jgi:hypothetical protein
LGQWEFYQHPNQLNLLIISNGNNNVNEQEAQGNGLQSCRIRILKAEPNFKKIGLYVAPLFLKLVVIQTMNRFAVLPDKYLSFDSQHWSKHKVQL